MECFIFRSMNNDFFHESPCTLWLSIKVRVWKLVFVKYHKMRSSDFQNLTLLWIRNKIQNFWDTGDQNRLNAFRTTQSAHSAVMRMMRKRLLRLWNDFERSTVKICLCCIFSDFKFPYLETSHVCWCSDFVFARICRTLKFVNFKWCSQGDGRRPLWK